MTSQVLVSIQFISDDEMFMNIHFSAFECLFHD